MAVPMLITSGTMLMVISSQKDEVEFRSKNANARALAVSGAQHGLAVLADNPAFVGTYQVDFDAGSSVVSIVDWEIDGVDNDDDGTVDGASEEDLLSITSAGFIQTELDGAGNVLSMGVGFRQRGVTAMANRVEFDWPINQAVYVDDPLSNLNLNGNAFLVSGHDIDPDGTPGPETALPAFGVPGDPADLIAQVAANQEDNLVGAGTDPSIMQVDPTDLPSLLAIASSVAGTTYSGSTTLSNGVLGDFENTVGEVTYCSDSLRLSGQTTGAGILAVEGDLEITGAFEFTGIVVVGGSVTFKGGAGDKNLFGALLTLGKVEAVANDAVELSGNIEIHFSSNGLAQAISTLDSIALAAWMED
jgi:hypothetical protein